MQLRVLAMIMAGGKGTRLHPLTRDRAKPAVPFGGKFRIVDFALSNFLNSGIYSVYVLTQFMSQSLTEHLQKAWNFSSLLDEHFITAVPAQMRTGETWYRGTADAIHQNLNLIRESRPHLVCIFGGDHVYRMDVSQMLHFHEHNEADCTVAAIPVPVEQASSFGVIEIDEDRRIVGFQEKPKVDPKTIPGDPTRVLASMGNYVFSCRSLIAELEADAANERSSHDFGKDVIPAMIKDRRVYCYDFATNRVPGVVGPNLYWRDVGTIESYYEANMDLREIVPAFNLYNRLWPIRTARYDDPPAKFVHDAENRTGRAVNSLVCEGSILSGSTVRNSIIGRNVKIHSFAEVTDSIVFDNVEIGRNAKVHRTIIDKNVKIPDHSKIGFDAAADAASFYVSSGGIVVIPKQPRYDADLAEVDI
ncbi:MAG TPA: glucose-1-phosphate adenylyltransferase [Planctomycetota bacterium]|nr:glucose-1-phosphate adenylyltransferase [Planctomycetota bacterium]